MRLCAVLMAASLLIGAGAAQSSWYPRSDNYTTTGWFVGDGLYLSGDGIIEGNLTVGGTIAGDASNDSHADMDYDPDTGGWTIHGFIDVYGWGIVDDFTAWYSFISRGPATFKDTAEFQSTSEFQDDVLIDADLNITGSITNDALDERIGAIEDDVGDVANMTTTATDLAGAIDELDADLGDLTSLNTTETGSLVGAINELDSDVTTLTERTGELGTNDTEQQAAIDALEMPPIWHVQTITAPDIAAADTVASTIAVNDSGVNLTAGDLDAQPDVARTLSFAPSAALTGFAWITGEDIDGNGISEVIEWSASTDTEYTTQAYSAITTIDMLKTDGDDRTMNIGLTDDLGMEVIPDSEEAVMFTWFDGDLETTLPTVTVGATIPECLINIDGTLDGTKDIRVYVYEAS